MIIRYPTALYKSVIPDQPSDSGNVTFVISNTIPPRDEQVITRLPPAIERRKRSASQVTLAQRLSDLGPQIVTITRLDTVAIESNKKQFEWGQVLEFLETSAEPLDPMRVGDVEIQHNTNKLDLDSLGLSDEEITKIQTDARTNLDLLYDQLKTAKSWRQTTEVALVENQKFQNETQKAIAAVEQLLLFDTSIQSTLDKLQLKLTELQDINAQLREDASTAASQAFELVDRIRDLSQVVR